MNIYEERRKLWVHKLRHGGLMQTQNVLHNDLGYCCLGVACEVAIENGLEIEVIPPDENSPCYYYDNHDDFLPTAVMEWFGMEDDRGSFSYLNEENERVDWSLADMNDSGHNFMEIAKMIERNPEGLFMR